MNVDEIVNGIKGGAPATETGIDPQRAGAFDSSPKTEADTQKGEGDVAPANPQVQNQPAPAAQETGNQQAASGS